MALLPIFVYLVFLFEFYIYVLIELSVSSGLFPIVQELLESTFLPLVTKQWYQLL